MDFYACFWILRQYIGFKQRVPVRRLSRERAFATQIRADPRWNRDLCRSDPGLPVYPT